MLSEDFKPQWIRELNEVGKQLQDVTVKIPSLAEQQETKDIIEQILPPEKGYVFMGFVRNVLIGLEYAETHYCDLVSMLDDIKAGEKPNISDYK